MKWPFSSQCYNIDSINLSTKRVCTHVNWERCVEELMLSFHFKARCCSSPQRKRASAEGKCWCWPPVLRNYGTRSVPSSVFINKFGTQTCSVIYLLSMAAFVLQQQSWVAGTEDVWPPKPKIFIYFMAPYKISLPASQWVGKREKRTLSVELRNINLGRPWADPAYSPLSCNSAYSKQVTCIFQGTWIRTLESLRALPSDLAIWW